MVSGNAVGSFEHSFWALFLGFGLCIAGSCIWREGDEQPGIARLLVWSACFIIGIGLLWPALSETRWFFTVAKISGVLGCASTIGAIFRTRRLGFIIPTVVMIAAASLAVVFDSMHVLDGARQVWGGILGLAFFASLAAMFVYYIHTRAKPYGYFT